MPLISSQIAPVRLKKAIKPNKKTAPYAENEKKMTAAKLAATASSNKKELNTKSANGSRSFSSSSERTKYASLRRLFPFPNRRLARKKRAKDFSLDGRMFFSDKGRACKAFADAGAVVLHSRKMSVGNSNNFMVRKRQRWFNFYARYALKGKLAY